LRGLSEDIDAVTDTLTGVAAGELAPRYVRLLDLDPSDRVHVVAILVTHEVTVAVVVVVPAENPCSVIHPHHAVSALGCLNLVERRRHPLVRPPRHADAAGRTGSR